MDSDRTELSSVMEAVLRHLRQIKSGILDFKRPEQDYPVNLSALLLALGADASLSDEDLIQDDDPFPRGEISEDSMETILASRDWEHVGVGRRTVHTSDGAELVFFLPGDEHFVDTPGNYHEYVGVLFALERRHRAVKSSADPAAQTSQGSVNRGFAEAIRVAYDRVLRSSRGAAYVRLPALRRETSLADSEFDRELLRLRDEGQIILSKHGHPAGLLAEELAGGIEVCPGEYYYYACMRS